MSKRKQCAVCGDKIQTNVKLKWQRHSDNTIFNVCCACAEVPNKVNEHSVQMKENKTYTTYNLCDHRVTEKKDKR